MLYTLLLYKQSLCEKKSYCSPYMVRLTHNSFVWLALQCNANSYSHTTPWKKRQIPGIIFLDCGRKPVLTLFNSAAGENTTQHCKATTASLHHHTNQDLEIAYFLLFTLLSMGNARQEIWHTALYLKETYIQLTGPV